MNWFQRFVYFLKRVYHFYLIGLFNSFLSYWAFQNNYSIILWFLEGKQNARGNVSPLALGLAAANAFWQASGALVNDAFVWVETSGLRSRVTLAKIYSISPSGISRTTGFT